MRTPAYGDPARSVWISSPIKTPHEDTFVPEMYSTAHSDESLAFDPSGLHESLRTEEKQEDKGNEHKPLLRSRDVLGDTLLPASSVDPPASHESPQRGLDISPRGSWDEIKQQPALGAVDAEAVGPRKGVVVDDCWVGAGGQGDGEVRDVPGLVATEMHEVDEAREREELNVEDVVEVEGDSSSFISEDYGSLQSKLARGPGEDSLLLSLDDYRPLALGYGREYMSLYAWT